MSILGRLTRLEKKTTGGFSEIENLIRSGAFYDELSPQQQAQYVKYKESLGGGASDLACAELEVLVEEKPKEQAYHFQLSKREPPLTQQELCERVEEVQQLMDEYSAEYNSPTAVEERKRDYERTLQIAEQRRNAFISGKDMDAIPLPWQ